MKEDFKGIRSKNFDQSFQSRILLTREEFSPDIYKYNSRKPNVESEILQKR